MYKRHLDRERILQESKDVALKQLREELSLVRSRARVLREMHAEALSRAIRAEGAVVLFALVAVVSLISLLVLV